MMFRDSVSRPYYYVLDRMYNVRRLVDRAGAIVERYVYDGYGRPYIRETCGRGDMDNDTVLGSTDTTRFTNAKNGSIWDPRADLDDDGDVDAADQTAYNSKQPTWDSVLAGDGDGPTVAQAFSDAGNFYMFQGVPHFAIDSAANATAAKLPLNHHRARYADPNTGKWISRDPAAYNVLTLSDELLISSSAEIIKWYHRKLLAISQHFPYVIDSESTMADGANTYSMLALRPTFGHDPSGLISLTIPAESINRHNYPCGHGTASTPTNCQSNIQCENLQLIGDGCARIPTDICGRITTFIGDGRQFDNGCPLFSRCCTRFPFNNHTVHFIVNINITVPLVFRITGSISLDLVVTGDIGECVKEDCPCPRPAF
jgi:hypothetical protein